MYKIIEKFPELKPYESDIELRMSRYNGKKAQLLGKNASSLKDFANAHEYYGFHHIGSEWVYREWAPAADQLYLCGDFNEWDHTATPMKSAGNGNWTLSLPDTLIHNGSKVITMVKNGKKLTQHLPLYTLRAVQDSKTALWCTEVWASGDGNFNWTDQDFSCNEPPLIYEAHVGMSGEEYRVATYREFADNVLKHVVDNGYNTIQLMGIMEHPYYGSFGYQVSNFFAASSRYGLPQDLKYLVNKAHGMGLRVLLDLVHSHAVKNTMEGINMFDGTEYQFFHEGPEGEHSAWGTKCFNYDKPEVLHFLLSNLKFWLTEYHFDGFRFDGVTSMLYHDHGLGTAFAMDKYFTMNTDVEAITYLQLANELVREVNPKCMTIAEDMSGMPGMCEPIQNGGIGFDYRLAMGEPDMWIKLVKETRDEDWNMTKIFTELTFRTAPSIGYVESHDQALVGDQTMIFRLAGADMYTSMDRSVHTYNMDRAISLHKMIRLITMGCGGNGYLNFMGNEFGHPEWIDFPRQDNGWSYHYCRRQWSLLNNGYLKYGDLYRFDHDMIHAAKDAKIFDCQWADLKWVNDGDQVIAFERGGLLFIFNFNPNKGFYDYMIPVNYPCDYQVLFTTDDECYNGYGRIPHAVHSAMVPGVQGSHIKVGLPSRTAMVLRSVRQQTDRK